MRSRTTKYIAGMLSAVFMSSCGVPKHFHSTYSQYQLERTNAATSPSDNDKAETGERYCSDLEREANSWSIAQTSFTVLLGIGALILAGVGTAAITFGVGSDSKVDVPVRNTGIGLQIGGVVLGGLATFTGLRSTAASRTAAEAGNVVSSQLSDPSRWRRCRAVLAAWEDRREDVKSSQGNSSALLLGLQKQLEELKKKATQKKDESVVNDIEKIQSTTDTLVTVEAE